VSRQGARRPRQGQLPPQPLGGAEQGIQEQPEPQLIVVAALARRLPHTGGRTLSGCQSVAQQVALGRRRDRQRRQLRPCLGEGHFRRALRQLRPAGAAAQLAHLALEGDRVTGRRRRRRPGPFAFGPARHPDRFELFGEPLHRVEGGVAGGLLSSADELGRGAVDVGGPVTGPQQVRHGR